MKLVNSSFSISKGKIYMNKIFNNNQFTIQNSDKKQIFSNKALFERYLETDLNCQKFNSVNQNLKSSDNKNNYKNNSNTFKKLTLNTKHTPLFNTSDIKENLPTNTGIKVKSKNKKILTFSISIKKNGRIGKKRSLSGLFYHNDNHNDNNNHNNHDDNHNNNAIHKKYSNIDKILHLKIWSIKINVIYFLIIATENIFVLKINKLIAKIIKNQ